MTITTLARYAALTCVVVAGTSCAHYSATENTTAVATGTGITAMSSSSSSDYDEEQPPAPATTTAATPEGRTHPNIVTVNGYQVIDSADLSVVADSAHTRANIESLTVVDRPLPPNNNPVFQQAHALWEKCAASGCGDKPALTYTREEFPHWLTMSDKDVLWPKNLKETYRSCTTRQATLAKDGHDTKTTKCKTISTGTDSGWVDIYGTFNPATNTIDYEPIITKSSKVDIDHIVPLKEIWRSQSLPLSDKARKQVANDYINLVATTAKTNRSKSDQSAASYLPPSDYRCEYVTRYAAVKARYGLTVTKAEKARLVDAANACGM